MTAPAVIYILGAGRSGSTLLERILGSAPGATAVGELHCLWRLPMEQLTCSCGAPGPECPFWRETRARAGLTDAALAELAALERTAIRHTRLIRRGAAYSRDPEVARWRAYQNDLFAAIAETADARTIIDSSKAAPRAWALSSRPRTSILHLRRRPGAVIAAWRRIKHDPSLGAPMRRPSAAAAAADWLRAEVSAARLAGTRPVTRLDYEDLAKAPRETVQALPSSPIGIDWRGDDRFRPDPDYHALGGNPDRFNGGEIVVRTQPAPDLTWLDKAAAGALGAALSGVGR